LLFVDDSISTTPESTMEAIKTYKGNIWTIFLGWHEYGFEFEQFAKFVSESGIKNIVFFPDTGEAIKQAIKATGYSYNSIDTDSMEQAVEFAYKNSTPWQVVLLSCASPSFSMYKNYKERWIDFKEMAKKLK
jgi:UDP-N-acetylmuramoylalanine--D-glutamate ligase